MMNAKTLLARAAILVRPLAAALALPAAASAADFEGPPVASIDLTTPEGAGLVRGQWRTESAAIVEVDFRAPGSDGQPTGAIVRTHDIEPKAGAAGFDDSAWEAIAPSDLVARRGGGRVSFQWYRIRVTVPEKIGAVDPTGLTIVFETVVDDYAEVWVDGEIARSAGQRGGSVVAGWNAPNRVVAARDVRKGQEIELAVFAGNGPISNAPTNFIWMRAAKLELHAGTREPVAIAPAEVNVEIERIDPAMDAIVGPNPKIWKLAEGFTFTEGPVWVPNGGYLLFSDPNENTIYKLTKAGELSVFRHPSGYSGADIAEYRQPGSNGLALDHKGRVTINEHGNRRIVRLKDDGEVEVVADRYEGKRFNSPNDLVYRSDGTLFVTDPPFGLPKLGDDPRKELAWSGVYAIRSGEVRLLVKDLTGPNGLAFSPDEKTLYVGNWDEQRKVVMRYDIARDGTLARGEVFADLTTAPGEDAIDGIKVDTRGNVFVSGPGGLWVFSREGRHLGTIRAPKHVHNMAFGDDDGKTLYLCARSGLYRMRLGFAGAAVSSVSPT